MKTVTIDNNIHLYLLESTTIKEIGGLFAKL